MAPSELLGSVLTPTARRFPTSRIIAALSLGLAQFVMTRPATSQAVDTSKITLSRGDSAQIQSRAIDANSKIDDLSRTVAELRLNLLSAARISDTVAAARQRRETKLKLFPRVLRASSDFLYTIVIGTASTFTGAGLANQEIRIQEVTSPWTRDKLRNGIDRAKPWADALGSLALGLSAMSSADGKQNNSRIFGVSGAALVAGFALLKEWRGGNADKDWQHAKGGLDSLQAQIEQVFLSRQAYNEIEIRRLIANRYYKSAGLLLDSLTRLRDSLQSVTRASDDPLLASNPSKQDSLTVRLIDYIDRLFATVATYESVVTFVDEYATNLSLTYGRYKIAFPLLRPQFEAAESEVVAFQTAFLKNIKGPWLDALPRYRVALADLRLELKR